MLRQTNEENPQEPLSDDALAREAAGGNAYAFEQLVRRHYMMMYKVAFKWCGRREDAEDIAQNACIKLGQNIRSFRFDAAFTTWLYRIVINAAKDYKRKQRDELPLFEDADIAAPGQSQEDAVMTRQMLGIVARLPSRLKEAVILVFAEGLSHKQAAEILGCAENTVSWRVHEARKQIDKTLKKKGAKT